MLTTVHQRSDLPRFQLPFPFLDFVIRDLRSRGGQRIQEFRGQRSALRLRQSQCRVLDFGEIHTLTLQTFIAAGNGN